MPEEQSLENEEQKRVRRSEHMPEQPNGTLDGVTPQEQAPLYPSRLLGDPKLAGRGNAPVRNAVVQQMQSAYGNRATRRLMQRSKNAGSGPSADTPSGKEHSEGRGNHTDSLLVQRLPVAEAPVASVPTPAGSGSEQAANPDEIVEPIVKRLADLLPSDPQDKSGEARA